MREYSPVGAPVVVSARSHGDIDPVGLLVDEAFKTLHSLDLLVLSEEVYFVPTHRRTKAMDVGWDWLKGIPPSDAADSWRQFAFCAVQGYVRHERPHR